MKHYLWANIFQYYSNKKCLNKIKIVNGALKVERNQLYYHKTVENILKCTSYILNNTICILLVINNIVSFMAAINKAITFTYKHCNQAELYIQL